MRGREEGERETDEWRKEGGIYKEFIVNYW